MFLNLLMLKCYVVICYNLVVILYPYAIEEEDQEEGKKEKKEKEGKQKPNVFISNFLEFCIHQRYHDKHPINGSALLS